MRRTVVNSEGNDEWKIATSTNAELNPKLHQCASVSHIVGRNLVDSP